MHLLIKFAIFCGYGLQRPQIITVLDMSTLLARNPHCWAQLWSSILQHGYPTHAQYASNRLANDRDGSCQLAMLHCLPSRLEALPWRMLWVWQEHKESMSSLTCPFTTLYPVLLCSWLCHFSLSRLLSPSRSMYILTSDYIHPKWMIKSESSGISEVFSYECLSGVSLSCGHSNF